MEILREFLERYGVSTEKLKPQEFITLSLEMLSVEEDDTPQAYKYLTHIRAKAHFIIDYYGLVRN